MGNFALFARNCLTSTFNYIVMQMTKGNCEKGYSLVKIFTRSRRDRGNRGEIAARFWPPRFPHLTEITAEIAARSRRDTGNLGGQKLAAISPRSRRDSRRDRSEIWKSRQANTRRDVAARSRRDTEISAAKTRRDREVISRRDMDISAGSFAARPRWEYCRGLRRETKFLAVKILLLSRREAKFSAAKLGSMRTIFTFSLTINQTTRR